MRTVIKRRTNGASNPGIRPAVFPKFRYQAAKSCPWNRSNTEDVGNTKRKRGDRARTD
jgi:hypothetical protein